MNDADFSNNNFTIVGLGLIGGSFAKSIKNKLKYKNLWAVDIDRDILNQAVSEGVIDEGFTDPKYPLENSDIVILCTYPNITTDFLKINMPYFKQNSIVTDTTGIKNKIITEIRSFIRNDINFIGGHPMCGKESIGYGYSSDSMFINGQYILTPENNTSLEAVNILTEIIKNIGFKTVSLMSPEKHDETIAFTSQLPHLIACTLMSSKNIKQSLNCIGGSFKDATRVADINSDLWSELIFENKNNIIMQLDYFLNDIKNIYDIINNNDIEGLKSIFAKSSLHRREMNK